MLRPFESSRADLPYVLRMSGGLRKECVRESSGLDMVMVFTVAEHVREREGLFVEDDQSNQGSTSTTGRYCSKIFSPVPFLCQLDIPNNSSLNNSRQLLTTWFITLQYPRNMPESWMEEGWLRCAGVTGCPLSLSYSRLCHGAFPIPSSCSSLGIASSSLYCFLIILSSFISS